MACACRSIPRTGYVFCNGEDRVPIPNDGNDPGRSQAIPLASSRAVDGDTMKVAWQVIVDGNLDNVDADYQGKYAFSTCYNSEEGVNARRDDGQRAGLGRHLQHQAHRGGGEARRRPRR